MGIAFKHFRRGTSLHATVAFLNKFLSYAKGAPIPILKALSERRGDRFQTFSARNMQALDFRIPK